MIHPVLKRFDSGKGLDIPEGGRAELKRSRGSRKIKSGKSGQMTARIRENHEHNSMSSIKVIIWGENIHEHKNEKVRAVYPDGMHRALADGLSGEENLSVETATFQERDHGLSEERLASVDVLAWWGHVAHEDVDETVVERIQRRVWEGMGLLVLHSGHFSKIFRRLMGTSCALKWRESGERERLWICNPGHPIVAGLERPYIELEQTEMYGEPFGIPPPEEQIFISWFEGGEVFRSGNVWRRGNGKIFYFSPGHETYPTSYHPEILKVIANACQWLAPKARWEKPEACSNVPEHEAREKIK